MEKRKMIKFSEIEQFRNIVKLVHDNTRYIGKDENGDVIFDLTKKLPTLTFSGTIKLHGFNAGITLTKDGDMYAQSRKNIITVNKDHGGFAFFVESNKEIFKNLFETLDIRDADYITIFGEMCGGNIQKGVAINGLPKMFMIFAVKLSYNNEDKMNIYLTDEEIKHLKNVDVKIFNILDFENYKIDIDFENPKIAQKKLIKITKEVERECPVGKSLGNSGVGEGVVWKCETSKGVIRFKEKGEKHAGKSNRKVLKPVDNVKLNKIQEVAMKVTPIWRLSQMLNLSCNIINGGIIDRKKLGDYLKLVIKDVLKEDIDIIKDAELEPKDVNKFISKIAKDYFFEQEQENL